MILVVAFVVVGLAVPLFGGRLSSLAQLRLRWQPLLYAALAVQLVIIEVLPSSFGGARAVHLLSYVMAIAFLVANRRLPGMVLVSLGATANVAAIAANGGVMPASHHALVVAGKTGSSAHFANSTTVAHAHLAFLGDVFAVPARFPLANVFSVGDVLLLVGGAVTVHAATGSRLVHRRQTSATTTVDLQPAVDAGP